MCPDGPRPNILSISQNRPQDQGPAGDRQENPNPFLNFPGGILQPTATFSRADCGKTLPLSDSFFKEVHCLLDEGRDNIFLVQALDREIYMIDSLTHFTLRLIPLLALGALTGCNSTASPPSSSANESAEFATAVEFYDIRVEDITSTSALLQFSTTALTSCEAEYGLNAEKLEKIGTDHAMEGGAFSIDHAISLPDLTPNTTYFYRGQGTTEAGWTFYSSIGQFTTLTATTRPPLENIALRPHGTTVIAVSSNFGGGDNDSSWGAYNAIDGQLGTEWATNGDGDSAFIEIDFGLERTVERFGFRSRKMFDGSSIITRVRLEFDRGIILGPYETPDPDQTYVFDFNEPVSARRVRLETLASTGGNTGIKELQFFAPAVHQDGDSGCACNQ